MKTLEKLEAELAALKQSIADLSHPVCQMLLNDSARWAQAAADRHVQWSEAIASEHAISAAYVRVRVKLQALDLPPGSTLEQIRAHTEARLDQVLLDRDNAIQQLAQREAEVEQLRHINDACIALENQLRQALQRAAQAKAILDQIQA